MAGSPNLSNPSKLRLFARNENHPGLIGVAVPYRLMEGYPKIHYDIDGLKATEQYLIRTVDVMTFLFISLPPPIKIAVKPGIDPETGENNEKKFLISPARRSMPGLTLLRTVSIDVEPHTGKLPSDPALQNIGRPDYDEDSLVTIEYDTIQPQEIDPDDPKTFLTISLNSGGQFLSVPPNKVMLKNRGHEDNTATLTTNRDEQLPLVKTIPTLEITARWERVLYPDFVFILGNLGKVNSDNPKFLAPDTSGLEDPDPLPPKETVLFMGFSAEQETVLTNKRDEEGNFLLVKAWKLEFRFSQRLAFEVVGKERRYYGWNHVWSPNEGGWRYVTQGAVGQAAGRPLYDSFEMDRLFTASELTP